MVPFAVDPGWYENYWLRDQPRPQPRLLNRRLGRFAVLVVLLTGSGFVLSQYHAHNRMTGLQNWEQE